MIHLINFEFCGYFLTGEILLAISFPQNSSFLDSTSISDDGSLLRKHADETSESPSRSSFSGPLNTAPGTVEETSSSKEEKSCAQKSLAGRIAQMFNKPADTASSISASSRGIDWSESSENSGPEVYENKSDDQSSSDTFEEAMRTMESRDQGSEIPSNLPGGVFLDQLYLIAPPDLNSLLFSPDSSFFKTLADLQGTTELQLGSWRFENGGESLKRVVTYIKAATKLVKAVKATEEQMYLKADGKVFAVFSSVSTPDVMYGSTFKVELLYCITPGPELLSGEQSSHLVISWRMNFLQSTMMKGMIEGGARQGIKESFEQYASLLSQNVKLVDSMELASNKEQVLASLQAEPQSDWKLAAQYFVNCNVIFTIFIGLYMLVHMWLCTPSTIRGLEFDGLDLPDSIGEFIISGILVLQGQRLLGLISRFLQARAQKGNITCYSSSF